MAPRGTSRRHRLSPGGTARRLELYRDATIDRRLGAGVGALAVGREGADTGHRIVIKTEIVLPVAIGDPEVDEMRVLRTHEGLAGVERQTDRLAVELGLGGGTEPADARKCRQAVGITLRSIPAGAAADREVLHVRRQEAEVHVVIDLDRPCRPVRDIAVRVAGGSGNAGTKQAALGE